MSDDLDPMAQARIDMTPPPDGDWGFPVPTELSDPYDEDGYCEHCGNSRWRHHAPWCKWMDAVDVLLSLRWRP